MKTIRETIWSDSLFGDESADFPRNLLEFRAWLDEKILEIPEEFRADAVFEVVSSGGYEWDYVDLTIFYDRPETQEEKFQREARQSAEAEAARLWADEQERIEFERLKAKFEGGSK